MKKLVVIALLATMSLTACSNSNSTNNIVNTETISYISPIDAVDMKQIKEGTALSELREDFIFSSNSLYYNDGNAYVSFAGFPTKEDDIVSGPLLLKLTEESSRYIKDNNIVSFLYLDDEIKKNIMLTGDIIDIEEVELESLQAYESSNEDRIYVASYDELADKNFKEVIDSYAVTNFLTMDYSTDEEAIFVFVANFEVDEEGRQKQCEIIIKEDISDTVKKYGSNEVVFIHPELFTISSVKEWESSYYNKEGHTLPSFEGNGDLVSSYSGIHPYELSEEFTLNEDNTLQYDEDGNIYVSYQEFPEIRFDGEKTISTEYNGNVLFKLTEESCAYLKESKILSIEGFDEEKQSKIVFTGEVFKDDLITFSVAKYYEPTGKNTKYSTDDILGKNFKEVLDTYDVTIKECRRDGAGYIVWMVYLNTNNKYIECGLDFDRDENEIHEQYNVYDAPFIYPEDFTIKSLRVRNEFDR